MKKKIMKSVLSLIVLILVTTVFAVPNMVQAFGPSSNTIYNGIDVSSWQRNIDFAAVKASGIDVVYIKSSEGNRSTDPYFRQNYNNAKANGLKVGFYHYVTARSVQEGINQAKFFASVISGTDPDCKLAMDFESFGSLSNSEINAIALAFIQTLESVTGKEALVYSNTYTARSIFSSELSRYPLWVAQYGVSQPSSNGKWNSWVGWQYTDQGSVNGISGYVDKDQYTEGIFLSNKGEIPSPTPTPDPTPTPGGETIRYTIQYGDTLSGIAAKYGTTVSAIASLNGISNPNVIYAGETIQIPGAYRSLDSGLHACGHEAYLVKSGDTLSSIANLFGVTVDSIVALNEISNPNLIYTGQMLLIDCQCQCQ